MTRRNSGLWRTARQARWAGSDRFATAISGPLSTIAIDIIRPALSKEFVQPFRRHLRFIEKIGKRDLARLFRRTAKPLNDEPSDHLGHAGVPASGLGVHQLR